MDLAERIVGWADEGEQVEAVVVHERETEVRAYEGEVESLTSAESQGVGVRVVRDGRQGFAYAGTLDPDALAEVLAEARDNLTFATPDEHCALAEPDGVEAAELDLYRATLVDHPTEAKVALALDLERRTRAADPRISGVESADYSDSISESAVATTTGILVTGRETGCFLSSYALAEQDGETQTGFGFSLGREPADLDVEEAAADAAERSTRMLGAVKPPSASGLIAQLRRRRPPPHRGQPAPAPTRTRSRSGSRHPVQPTHRTTGSIRFPGPSPRSRSWWPRRSPRWSPSNRPTPRR